MRIELRQHILKICEKKIQEKGNKVGISFYAFFENKNTNPELLMECASWWIMKHKLNHFEKAEKIKNMIESNL